MPTFVALLRGVNVGKSKRVPMGELRALLSGMGYTGVATLLNSGNAVFRESEAAVALLGQRGTSVTTRNWATVLKLQALAKEAGA